MTNYENQSWYVHKHKIRVDYPKIENLKQFLAPLPPILPKYHPDYIKYWSKETKKCIEGIWRQEFGKWRYMPGNLYFFGSFTVLEDTKLIDGVKVTKHFKPLVVDYYWEFAAQSWAAYGFSGFEKDDEYTCNNQVVLFNEGKIPKSLLLPECLRANGDVKKYRDPFEYILALHDRPLGKSLFQNEASDTLVFGCHRKGTLVRMHDGSTKAVEDILEGDLLMGVDSTPRKVLKLHRGREKFFEVRQKYGDAYYVNENHILAVYKKGSWRNKCSGKSGLSRKEHVEYITAKKVYDQQEKTKNCVHSGYVGYSECAIEYPEKPLVYDPYWFGLWLGDGFKREKMICVSQKEPEIRDWIISYATSNGWGYSIKTSKSGLGASDTWRITIKRNDGESTKLSWFAKNIQNNKHIPAEYMINSRENRLKVLAGYIDSDGHYEKKSNRYTIASVDYNLLRQTLLLAKSLGFRAKIEKGTRTGITNSIKFNLRIYGKLTDIPCLLARKKAVRDSVYTGFSSIVSKPDGHYNTLTLTHLPEEDYYGFELDGDHLFLLEDYTVTHNSRGGGKSYFAGLGELEYNFVFGGARRYDQDFIDGKYASRQLVGSADTTKSGELYDKFEKSQAAKLDNKNDDFVKWFGIYTEVEIDSKGNNIEKVTPCPFYKKASGNLQCPNKLNPYRAKYKVEKNGEWIEEGTGSELVHVNYSTKKADGFTAGVGGRYLYSNIEEVGLVANAIAVKGANDSATRRSGLKFGVQAFQGTSGSIEHVQEAKKLFLSPQDYGILKYKNIFSQQGSDGYIAYYLPNYIVHFDCKDENGNTDYDKVIDKINRARIEKANSKEPKVLRDFIMNEPVYVPEMWITDKGYLLPYEEASERERELMKHQLYKEIGKNVELVWNSDGTVKHKILHNATPINQWPLPKNTKDISGNVVIYEFPEEGPNDLYLICHDPYVEENLDGGGSLGVTYVLKNPKYISNGRSGNIIVASYIGKPAKGLEYYYEQQEKLIAFYGNPQQGLWYEKNRGEVCREYYIRKGKQYLLCLTPQYMQGSSIYQQTIRSFGFVVGNKNSKLNLIKITHDWLLESTEFMEYGQLVRKLNIFRIPDKFLIDQIMQYNLDENFDGVSAFMGGILGLREIYAREEQEILNKPEVDIFANIKKNNRIFKNVPERDEMKKPYNEKELVPSQFPGFK